MVFEHVTCTKQVRWSTNWTMTAYWEPCGGALRWSPAVICELRNVGWASHADIYNLALILRRIEFKLYEIISQIKLSFSPCVLHMWFLLQRSQRSGWQKNIESSCPSLWLPLFIYYSFFYLNCSFVRLCITLKTFLWSFCWVSEL